MASISPLYATRERASPLIVNALLVRWGSGYFEVEDTASVAADGRHEEMFSLSDTRSVEEATRIAEATLADYARVRVSVEATVEPLDASEVPYEGFDVGDTVTIDDETDAPASVRVVALSASEDTEGGVFWTPEFGDIIDQPGVRTTRWLGRMVNGTLAGKSESAQPITNPVLSREQPASPPVPTGGVTVTGTDVYVATDFSRGNPGGGIGESNDLWLGPQTQYQESYGFTLVDNPWVTGAGTQVEHFDGDGRIHIAGEAGWFLAQVFCSVGIGSAGTPRLGIAFLAAGGGLFEANMTQAATDAYGATSIVFLDTYNSFDVNFYYKSSSGDTTADFENVELHLTRLSNSGFGVET